MTIRTTFIVLAAVLLSAAAYAQTLYKTVGPDGKVTYSDQQPQGNNGKVLKYAGPTATAAQAQRSRVVLYSAAWCGYCTQAKAYMTAANIRFDEIDVETSAGRTAYAMASGSAPTAANQRASGIPYLVMGDKKQRGYSAQGYDNFFASLREPVPAAR